MVRHSALRLIPLRHIHWGVQRDDDPKVIEVDAAAADRERVARALCREFNEANGDPEVRWHVVSHIEQTPWEWR